MAVGTVGKKALEAINELVRRGVSPNEIYRKTGYKRGIDGNWAVPAAVGVGAAGQSEETEAGLIQSAVRKAFPGVKVDLREQGDNLIVDRIVVPEADREKGVGSAVMGMINDIADKEGKQVALTPSSDFGGNKKRLESFYKRMGFVPNKGRSRDLSVSESMIRPLAFGGVGLTGLAASPDSAMAASTGTIEAPAAPWLVDAANYMRRLELPIVGRPLEGLADWAEGAAYQDPDRLKRAAIGALDLM